MTKELVTMKTGDLIPYENNPRNNEGAIEAVKESITQVGYISPIIIDEDNVVLAGHTRLKSIQEIGAGEVEVLKVGGLSEEEKRKFRLLDNKTNEFASWDMAKLEFELEDLDFGDFDFGFDLEGIVDGIKGEGNFDESDFNYQEQYGVTVMCKDESEQEKVYNWLSDKGYDCKVVTV